MISIRRIRSGEGQLYKKLRLAALQESPYAFTTTFESASQRSWESWCDQADGSAAGPARSIFFAHVDGSPAGLGAVYRYQDRTDQGEIVQVWVAPEHRGSGVAQELLNGILDWSRENGLEKVFATVTEVNARALRFYQKLGFVMAELSPEYLLVRETGGGTTAVKGSD